MSLSKFRLTNKNYLPRNNRGSLVLYVSGYNFFNSDSSSDSSSSKIERKLTLDLDFFYSIGFEKI